MNALELLKQEFFRPILTLLIPGLIFTTPITLWLLNNPLILNLWEKNNSLSMVILVLVSIGIGLIFEDIASQIEGQLFKVLTERVEREVSSKEDLRSIIFCVEDYKKSLCPRDFLRQEAQKQLENNKKEMECISFSESEYKKSNNPDGVDLFLQGLFLERKAKDKIAKNSKTEVENIFSKYLHSEIDQSKVNGVGYLNTIVLRMKFELGTLSALAFSGWIWIYLFTNIFCWPENLIWIAAICTSAVAVYLFYEGYHSVLLLHKIREVVISGVSHKIEPCFFGDILRFHFGGILRFHFGGILRFFQGLLILIILIYPLTTCFMIDNSSGICVFNPGNNSSVEIGKPFLISGIAREKTIHELNIQVSDIKSRKQYCIYNNGNPQYSDGACPSAVASASPGSSSNNSGSNNKEFTFPFGGFNQEGYKILKFEINDKPVKEINILAKKPPVLANIKIAM
jgi:hypothetical protein